MPQFMDVHEGFLGVTQAQVEEAHRKDLEVEAGEGVHFKQWWGDPTSGKVFCLSEGPSRDAVYRVHEKAGHPTEQIWEVPLSGS
ncbi:MAG: SCO4226 family nickel-binding protein [Dehalococcoidia bacterium]|nr:SCO4226 family nickel-binding protein [Dehalococcoidia bacterium]